MSFHIFSPQVPDGKFPRSHSTGPVIGYNHEYDAKFTAWKDMENSKRNPHMYFYHGLFESVYDNALLIRIDPLVEKSWNTARVSDKFGI